MREAGIGYSKMQCRLVVDLRVGNQDQYLGISPIAEVMSVL